MKKVRRNRRSNVHEPAASGSLWIAGLAFATAVADLLKTVLQLID